MKQFLLLLLFIYPLCVFAQPNGRNSIETIIITDVQVKAIDSIVNAVYKADEPGASVLLAQNGKILLRKGYGMANMELRVPVYPDHVFAIASMSKYFTAVAILILQEQGKLNVKDDVHKYMPAYNTHGKTISIENLLTHTSGIPGDGEMQSYGVKAKLEESRYTGMQFSEDQPLLFEPGTNWSYSNPGFNLLAFIVEKASGQSFKEFVQQNILNKLGMNQTYFGRKGVIPLKTTGYAFNQQRNIYERIEEGSYVESKFLGSGSIYSTVDDLYRWHNGLKEGKIISPALLKKAWTSYTLSDGTDAHYAYGRSINIINNHSVVGHAGALPNYLSYEWQMPDDNIYFVILSNQRQSLLYPILIADKVAALIMGIEPEPQIKIPDSAQLLKLIGVYETEATGSRLQKNYSTQKVFWDIFQEAGKLYVKRIGAVKRELLPFNDSTWYTKTNPFGRFTFRKNAAGQTIGLKTSGLVTQHGPDRFGKKISDDIPSQPVSIAMDSTGLVKYCGIFQQEAGTRQKLMIERNKLMLTDEDNLDKKELSYTGNHSFFDLKTDILYNFIADKKGNIIELNYFNGTWDIVAKRIRDNYKL